MKKTDKFLYKTNIAANPLPTMPESYMNFFEGQYFSLAGSIPESTSTIQNVPLYYGIQFCRDYIAYMGNSESRGDFYMDEGSYDHTNCKAT